MATMERESNRTRIMNESMASDAPDTVNEGRGRSCKNRRPTPAPRAAPVGRATRTVRGGTGPPNAAPATPAARGTSGQSSTDSDDEEAREDAVMKKLHPWLPNWSWIQGEPQPDQKPDRGRSTVKTMKAGRHNRQRQETGQLTAQAVHLKNGPRNRGPPTRTIIKTGHLL